MSTKSILELNFFVLWLRYDYTNTQHKYVLVKKRIYLADIHFHLHIIY
jgi:hypothetical protein